MMLTFHYPRTLPNGNLVPICPSASAFGLLFETTLDAVNCKRCRRILIREGLVTA